MPFNGVNAKCQKCVRDCRQWEQVKVINCPKFVDKRRQTEK